MRGANGRWGLAEYVTLAGLVAIAIVVGLAVQVGWTIAIVPGVAYAVASGATYLLYRQYQRERAAVAQPSQVAMEERPGPAPLRPRPYTPVPQLAGAVAFRVVGTRGKCPQGRGFGDVVMVGQGGNVTPRLCPHAEAALRMAAAAGSQEKVQEWCCPVYDHLLVFRRESQVA